MGLRRLTDRLHQAAGSTGSRVRQSARDGVDALGRAPGRLAAALPSRDGLRQALGNALVSGGKVLIDPRAALGEAAVRLGESLLADPGAIRWFVIGVRAADASESWAFHDQAEARACLERLRAAGCHAYLCEVVDRPAGK